MTRAIVLAAGKGERLRPYTDNRPKSLVELFGKPLLLQQADVLRKCGVTNIHVAVGYKAEMIEALGFSTTPNPRYDHTNMVETLFCAESFMDHDEDLIISYGDIIYQPENLQVVLDCEGDLSLMIDRKWKQLWDIRMDNPLDDAETLILDDNGFIEELGKKPTGYEQIQGQYTGLIKVPARNIKAFLEHYHSLDRSALYDGKDFQNMYMTSFLQNLIDNDWKVKAAIVENGWLELDSVDDLTTYTKMAENHSLDHIYKTPA